jgi:hypothetical protein
MKKQDVISFVQPTYLIKDIDYSNGKALTIFDKHGVN